MRNITLTLAALLVIPLPILAQTMYSYNGGGSTADWSRLTNWSGSLIPPSGNQTVVRFSGNSNGGNPNQNLVNPFMLNQLEFVSTLPAIKLVGAALKFASTSSANPPDLIVSGSNPVEIANPLELSGNLQIDVQKADGSLILSGGLSSTSTDGLNKGGPGSLTLSGGGPLKFLRADVGSLHIAGGTYTVPATAGSDIRFRGAADITGGATLTSPLLEIGDTGSPIVTIAGGSSITADTVHVSRGSTAVSQVTVTGTGTSLHLGAIGIGGGATGGAGGAATFAIESGATLQANSMLIHPQGKLILNSGSALQLNTVSFTASSNLDWRGGTLHLTGTNSLNSSGLRSIDVTSASALLVDGALTIENNNLLQFSGGTGMLQDVAVGPNGTSSPGNLIISANSISMTALSIGGGLVGVGGGGALTVSSTISIESGGELSLTSTATPRLTAGSLVLNGGVISGNSTLNMSSIGTLRGHGAVTCKINGSGPIVAEGDIVLGNSASTAGYENTGTLTIAAGASAVLLDADAAYLGSITLGADSSFVTLNGATLPAGATLSASASARVTGRLSNSGTVAGPTASGQWLTLEDAVSGRGNFSGNIRMADDFAPGTNTASALITFAGNVQFGTGDLRIDLGGSKRGTSYDALNCTGSLTLDGTLTLSLFGGYVPALGTSFDLFNFASLAGSFSSVYLPPLPGDFSWDTSNLYTTGIITVIPEPNAVAIGLTAAAVCFSRKRRRKTVCETTSADSLARR